MRVVHLFAGTVWHRDLPHVRHVEALVIVAYSGVTCASSCICQKLLSKALPLPSREFLLVALRSGSKSRH
jgi:hypothetical protein